MRLGKGLVLGLAASMLAASILSLASIVTTTSGNDDPLSVPTGRYGDRVEYAGVLVETGLGVTGVPTPYTLAVEVLGASRTVDRWAHAHDVVLLAQRHSLPGQIPVYLVPETAKVDYVELEHRDSVRVDRFNEGVGSIASFGPIGPDGVLAANHSLLRHQGRSYAPGSALVDREAQLGLCARPETDRTIHIVGSEYVVARVGHVNAERAFELRLRQSYWYEDEEGGRTDGVLEESVWITEASAYPVRTERHREERHPQGGTTWSNDTRWLTAFQPGDEPIPWKNPGGDPCPAFGNTELVRSGPTALFPTHGDETRFRYRLEDAYRNVFNDRTLVAFQAWLLANPDRRLVGGYYWLNTTDPKALNPFEMWGMYVAGREDVVIVQSQRPSDGGPIVNAFVQQDKAGPKPSIAPGDGPQNPLTLGQLTKIYRQVASANWTGYDQFAFGHNGPMTAKWDPHGPPTPEGTKWYYTDLQVGRVQWLREVGAARDRMAILDVNLTSGEVLFYREGPYSFYLPRPGAASAQPQAPIAPAAATGARPAPDFEAAAVAAMGALAVFLLIYFFPAIKFLAGRIVELWPGYAKLDRDDVLGHRLREELLQLIQRRPGVRPPELQAATGAAWSTLVYHLRVLEKNKVVSSLVDGRHKRFFPTASVGANERTAIAAVSNPNTRRVLEGVRERPGIIQSALAVHVGITAQGVKWHLDRLEKARLLERKKRGRAVQLFPVVAAEAEAS